MRSLDANVLLRVLLQDDPKQTPIAERIIGEPAIILSSVVTEVVWVLMSRKLWAMADIATAMRDLIDLPHLWFLDRQALLWAFSRAETGAGFADMMHLYLSGRADSFATFDREIARYVDENTVSVETLG